MFQNKDPSHRRGKYPSPDCDEIDEGFVVLGDPDEIPEDGNQREYHSRHRDLYLWEAEEIPWHHLKDKSEAALATLKAVSETVGKKIQDTYSSLDFPAMPLSSVPRVPNSIIGTGSDAYQQHHTQEGLKYKLGYWPDEKKVDRMSESEAAWQRGKNRKAEDARLDQILREQCRKTIDELLSQEERKNRVAELNRRLSRKPQETHADTIALACENGQNLKWQDPREKENEGNNETLDLLDTLFDRDLPNTSESDSELPGSDRRAPHPRRARTSRRSAQQGESTKDREGFVDTLFDDVEL
ncbi:MAG: hypothetical protein M1829_006900 [Trizodia sp. TS-e1964]|nr:MAG: hypothetical protein M1829_006900 [Trizodia sp. TS-e1964]